MRPGTPHPGRVRGGLTAAALALVLGSTSPGAGPARATEPPVGAVAYMTFGSTQTASGVQITAGHPQRVGASSVHEILIGICNRTATPMPVGPESFSHTFGDHETSYYTQHPGHRHTGLPQVMLGRDACVTGSLVTADRRPNQLAFHDISRRLRIDILPAAEWGAISAVATPVSLGAPTAHGDVTGDARPEVFASQGTAVSAYHTLAGPRLGPRQRVGGSGSGPFTWLSKTPDLDGNRISDLLARDRQGRMHYLRVMEQGRLAMPVVVGENWGAISVMAVVETGTPGSNPWLLARTATGDLLRYQLTPQGIRPGGVIGRHWHAITALVSVGDVSGDQIPDLLAIDRQGTLLRYTLDASGRITGAGSVGHGWQNITRVFSPGDLNHDGRRDLAAVSAEGHLYFWANLGNGRWGPATMIGQNWGGVDLLA